MGAAVAADTAEDDGLVGADSEGGVEDIAAAHAQHERQGRGGREREREGDEEEGEDGQLVKGGVPSRGRRCGACRSSASLQRDAH